MDLAAGVRSRNTPDHRMLRRSGIDSARRCELLRQASCPHAADSAAGIEPELGGDRYAFGEAEYDWLLRRSSDHELETAD